MIAPSPWNLFRFCIVIGADGVRHASRSIIDAFRDASQDRRTSGLPALFEVAKPSFGLSGGFFLRKGLGSDRPDGHRGTTGIRAERGIYVTELGSVGMRWLFDG
jgi:hypothetical protein